MRTRPLTATMLAALARLAKTDEADIHERTGTALVDRKLATICVYKDSVRLQHYFGRTDGRYRHFYSFTYRITEAGRSILANCQDNDERKDTRP